ncbi:hypothetical protein HYDPIDRAFT_93478 [Hydnomerulius pinastri MD-312]|uniref:DUF1479-domain-containing protein n=1 Tax=Hydnomerulius pinastri MD-312 TaxID=994086 RepID=A0A0C9WDB0_9AGAM|nr:hypothetical protein HYDPIDRAFT_93478 [Hydnomerulius pinastri MD-312]
MESYEWPSRFLDLKREIVSGTTEEQLTASWNDLLNELAKRTTEIAQAGPNFVPQINFTDLEKLTPEEIDIIRRKGSVVIRGVVDPKEAAGWKTALEEFIKANPHAEGFPENDKQFFHLYWTRSQVQARAHPNVLKASAWLNNLYHVKSGKQLEGVDLSVPLVYADRFRIRHPGVQWGAHPPHVDGGAIERWEDENFRRVFQDVLNGNWRQHDPYELEHRLDARSSLYGRPGQATVLRTFQGWLAMSETAPTQGTLRVFPDVALSNAYTILRPFFRPTVPLDSPDILDAKNWVFDISTADFPGIRPMGTGFTGPRPTPDLHPHLRLEETMTSVPKVNPGDMVFWHCDVVHSVEQEHTGDGDSAVMYIPAVPKTPQNSEYVIKQVQTFLAGENPPDFAKFKEGTTFVGLGTDADVKEPISRIALGLPIQVA